MTIETEGKSEFQKNKETLADASILLKDAIYILSVLFFTGIAGVVIRLGLYLLPIKQLALLPVAVVPFHGLVILLAISIITTLFYCAFFCIPSYIFIYCNKKIINEYRYARNWALYCAPVIFIMILSFSFLGIIWSFSIFTILFILIFKLVTKIVRWKNKKNMGLTKNDVFEDGMSKISIIYFGSLVMLLPFLMVRESIISSVSMPLLVFIFSLTSLMPCFAYSIVRVEGNKITNIWKTKRMLLGILCPFLSILIFFPSNFHAAIMQNLGIYTKEKGTFILNDPRKIPDIKQVGINFKSTQTFSAYQRFAFGNALLLCQFSYDPDKSMHVNIQEIKKEAKIQEENIKRNNMLVNSVNYINKTRSQGTSFKYVPLQEQPVINAEEMNISSGCIILTRDDVTQIFVVPTLQEITQ